MSDMTEEKTENVIILAGRLVGFTPPTQGQLEAMVRISRTMQAGADDDRSEFWIKQISRIGTLLESMINEADRDLVDELYLTGKIDHTTLLTAILTKVNENAVKSEDKAIAKAKVTTARVKRR